MGVVRVGLGLSGFSKHLINRAFGATCFALGCPVGFSVLNRSPCGSPCSRTVVGEPCGADCDALKQGKMPRCPLLISFWIEGTDRYGPHGFGVTAWSKDDAIALIRTAGFTIDADLAIINPNVWPHEVDYTHVARNAGPAVFRGVWYPCLNIGWGANGQR